MSFSRRPSLVQRVQSEASLQLLDAARQGNETLVEGLLNNRQDVLPAEASMDINARGEGQMTPLHLATRGNYHNVVILLLGSESIDVNAQDELGRTALIIAAQKGLTDVTRILLQEERANVLVHAQGGYTALHVAAWHGHTEVTNILLGICEPPPYYGYEKLASPRSPDNSRKGSSKFCSNNSSYHRESKFRIFKSPETSSRKSGFSSSERKSRKSSSSSLSLNKGSVRSKDSRDTGSQTEKLPQIQPYRSDNLRLLEAKTSPELFTALHLAAGNGHVEVVVSLIQAYGQAVGIAEVLASVREKGGKDALDLVMASIIRILNSRGEGYSSEDVRTDVLDKALGTIFLQGFDITSLPWSSVDKMVSFVNEKDCIGRTPLHHATWEQHLEVVEKLLGIFIVNVNATDMDGYTVLHLGCRKGADAIVQSIISHDSKLQTLSPNLAAKQNRATRARVVEVKRLQQKLGTVLVSKNLHDCVLAEERNGMTALHYAVEGSNCATVAALAGRPDIDVFAVASPGSNLTIMEALAGPQDGDQKEQSPLTMAISAENGDILSLLLKSGRRNKIMQDVESLRNYFSKHDKGEETRRTVKEYHRKLMKVSVGLIRRDTGRGLQSDMFLDLENELVVVLNTLLHKPLSNNLTLLHHAAFAGLSLELESLLSIPDLASNINAIDEDRQTPLHFAAMGAATDAVKVLINDKALRPNEEDSQDRTALQIATEKRSRDIISLLMGCPDVKLAVDTMYRDRVVNDNAANAILVVAALIASVTFAGWLQPPLGLREYYNLQPRHGEPPGTIDSYAAVQQTRSVLYFWIFNSLSFFFAMGTVISGAAEVLPMRDAFIGQEVRMVRGGLMRTSIMLVMSIVCVLVAFSAAGFASLPPLHDYQKIMVYTTLAGGMSCLSMLSIFWTRMMGSVMGSTPGERKVKWWRWHEDGVLRRPLVVKLLWKCLKFYNLIPENYARFESRKQGDNEGWRRKMFWMLVKFFKLDREEFGRYDV